MVKRIIIAPDMQMPYHNPKQVRNFIKFVGQYQPDTLLHIGDLADFPQPSRWNKDTRGEFEGSAIKDAAFVRRNFFEPMREVFSGEVLMHESNHDERPQKYLEKYAPALVDDDYNPFSMDALFQLEDYNVTNVGGFHDIAPGWISTHGHLGMRLTQVAGMTAMGAARKFKKSIVCGHTHRQALAAETTGWGSHRETIYGLEVGHMMDPSKAGYLKAGANSANWQAGFGVLYVDGKKVTPVAVPMDRSGSFIFEGERWF